MKFLKKKVLPKSFILSLLLLTMPAYLYAGSYILVHPKDINKEPSKQRKYYGFYTGITPCGKPLKFSKDADESKARYAGTRCINTLEDLKPGEGVVKYLTKNEAGCSKGQILVAQSVSCELCHVPVMVKNIIDWLIAPPAGIAYLFGSAIIAVAAFYIIISSITGGGDPKYISKARNMIQNVVIGLVLMLSSWAITNTFLWMVGLANWTGWEQGWFQINCPIPVPPKIIEADPSLF